MSNLTQDQRLDTCRITLNHIKNGRRSHNASCWHKSPTKTALKNLDEIAKSVVRLASALKTKSCEVSISSITARSDQYRRKAVEVNKELKNLCLENNLFLIDHGNTINTRHVNGSKLLLNKKGTRILFNNFKEAISNILHGQILLHSSYNGNNGKDNHDSNDYIVKPLRSIRDVQSLNNILMRNMNKIIIARLNINSPRNKFENLQEQINGNVDILLISETKLDNSFPNGQFLIKGYSAPYRLDRGAKGEGIILFIGEYISSKL